MARFGRLVAVGFAVLVTVPPVARALECDPGICAGNPCTISGGHPLTQSCTLDFSGKDVTIAPDGSLSAPVSDSDIRILARNLTVHGSITAVGAFLDITVEQNLATLQSSGPGIIKVRRGTGFSFGYLSITAGGDVTVAGRKMAAGGDDSGLVINGANVQIDTAVIAISFRGEVAEIDIGATGSITTTGRIRAVTRNLYGIGAIGINAEGDITIDGPLEATRNGTMAVDSNSGDVHVNARVRADATNRTSEFRVFAAGTITVQGEVLARGRGFYDGSVQLSAPAVSVTGTVDARGPSGRILIGPSACSVTISGSLLAAGDFGGNSIYYREQLDVTGGTLLTGADGQNYIACRCVDPPACDGGCVSDPVGLDQATIEPPATIVPTNLAPC